MKKTEHYQSRASGFRILLASSQYLLCECPFASCLNTADLRVSEPMLLMSFSPKMLHQQNHFHCLLFQHSLQSSSPSLPRTFWPGLISSDDLRKNFIENAACCTGYGVQHSPQHTAWHPDLNRCSGSVDEQKACIEEIFPLAISEVILVSLPRFLDIKIL